MSIHAGDIYRHNDYYRDRDTGRPLAKFLLVLAAPVGDDVVYRLLTSRDYARCRDPRCDHVGSYPGFFLGGRICNELPLDTWIDLRPHPDFDGSDFRVLRATQVLLRVHTLEKTVRRDASLCVATAADTTRHQARRIMNALH